MVNIQTIVHVCAALKYVFRLLSITSELLLSEFAMRYFIWPIWKVTSWNSAYQTFLTIPRKKCCCGVKNIVTEIKLGGVSVRFYASCMVLHTNSYVTLEWWGLNFKRSVYKKTPLKVHFMYLGNKEIYCILRHAAWSRLFFHKMLFVS